MDPKCPKHSKKLSIRITRVITQIRQRTFSSRIRKNSQSTQISITTEHPTKTCMPNKLVYTWIYLACQLNNTASNLRNLLNNNTPTMQATLIKVSTHLTIHILRKKSTELELNSLMSWWTLITRCSIHQKWDKKKAPTDARSMLL